MGEDKNARAEDSRVYRVVNIEVQDSIKISSDESEIAGQKSKSRKRDQTRDDRVEFQIEETEQRK